MPANHKNYPGRPPEGKVLWGATLGEQDVVTRHEEPSGETMELHRLFYQWHHLAGDWCKNQITENIEAGRHVWVSFKPPGSWKDVGDGVYDVEIANMLQFLDHFGVPIWLTIHHEPEGGGGDDPGGATEHRRMNRKVRELMDAIDIRWVSLSLVLMGWTWDERAGRQANDWWDGDIYDFIGIDHYYDGEKTLVNALWAEISAWAYGKGVDIAVGEWGLKGTDGQAGDHVREWYDHAVATKAPRTVALAAFDHPSDQWKHGLWQLNGEQLVAFHEKMVESAAWAPPVPEPEPEPEPTQTFSDVPPGHTFYGDIEWIAAEGITKGHEDGTYRPNDYVTRGQMAAFIRRALDK